MSRTLCIERAAGARPDPGRIRDAERLASQTRYAVALLRSARSTIRSSRLQAPIQRRVREPILVEAMERHGHLQVTVEVRTDLLSMSAATINRALREARNASGGRKRRHAPPSAAIRRSVAVRTFDDWDSPAPGFVEANLVAHSGPTARAALCRP
jgi:hypothetical protein